MSDGLKVGDEVDLVITRAEDYGLWSTYGDFDVLILITEVSWTASFGSCKQVATAGDRVKAKVIRLVPEERKASASMKACSSSPWHADGPFRRGAEFDATVIRQVEAADRCDEAPGVLVQVLPGCLAMLCGESDDLAVGEMCRVRVEACSVERQALELKWIDPAGDEL